MLAAISYPPIPIWDIGPLRFSLHGLAAAVGFVLGGMLATRRLARRGFDTQAYQSVLSWAIVGALVGARYLTSPAALLAGTPVGEALNPFSGNFSIMGGFAGGIIAGIWRMRKVRLPVLATLDASSFGLALGTIVGRLGDLAIVEHLGGPTGLPFGFGVRPGYDLAPMHNALECAPGSQLVDGFCPVPASVYPQFAGQPGIYHHVAAYDLLGAALLLFVLYRLVTRRLHYGQLFSIWVIWYGTQRFLLDFLRYGNGDATLGPLTWNQVSGVAAAVGGLLLFLRFRASRPVVGAEADEELRAGADLALAQAPVES